MSKGSCIQIIRDKKRDDTLKDTILSMPLLSVSFNNFRSSSPTGVNEVLTLGNCSNICNDHHLLTSLYEKVLDIRETVLHKEFFTITNSTHKMNNDEIITQMNNPQSLNEIMGDNFFEHVLIMEKDRLSHSGWQINQFPNFLRSAAMSQTSWEVLKLKYQEKILKSVMIEKDINITSNISNKNDIINVKFLISLLGSSVTAGHDSPFNESFSELLGPIMEPAFAPFFKLEVKNGALGNNPCLPYDVCVRTFAGADADIVHWEQSFNCFGTDAKKSYVFEQFIRQALTMPNKPVIAFSDSAMPNWKEDVCKEPAAKSPVTISPEEKRMLDYLRTGNAMKVVSELNKNEINRPWSALLNLFKEYKTLGIQMWLHDHYERYKCHGPYVATWGCCSRSWHPSLLGHQLRAAHFAFFWLLIYKDALVELRKNGSEMLLKELHDAKKHIDHELKHIPTKAIFDPMGFSDNMQCYTTFQPLGDPSLDMFKIVIPSGEGKNGFKNIIFEELTSPEIIKKAKASGYLDFKHLLYGNIDSGVLSFNITVQKVGVAFLCQPCGNWGKLPNGFKYFWEIGTQIYLTKDIAAIPEGQFNFSPEKATNLKYTNRAPKDSQTICVDFEMQFPAGQHILTIVPTTKDNIMVSYLLLP